MFQRLKGESVGRFRKDKHITGMDLREGNLGRLRDQEGYQVTQSEFMASGWGKSLTLDEYGFIWHHPPSEPIAAVIEQQRLHEAQLRADRDEKKKTPIVGKDIVKSDRVLRTPQPKRKVSPDATTASVKKPHARKPSDQLRKVNELEQVFKKLNVVKEDVQRARANSLKKKNKGKSTHPEPQKMPIPVTEPSPVQKNIWEVIERRVRAVKERRVVNISKEGLEAMSGPPNQVLKEVEEIAGGLAEKTGPEDSLLVYTQSIIDLLAIQIHRQQEQTSK